MATSAWLPPHPQCLATRFCALLPSHRQSESPAAVLFRIAEASWLVVDVVKVPSDVGLEYVSFFLCHDAFTKAAKCLVWVSPWPESACDFEEISLVNRTDSPHPDPSGNP